MRSNKAKTQLRGGEEGGEEHVHEVTTEEKDPGAVGGKEGERNARGVDGDQNKRRFPQRKEEKEREWRVGRKHGAAIALGCSERSRIDCGEVNLNSQRTEHNRRNADENSREVGCSFDETRWRLVGETAA